MTRLKNIGRRKKTKDAAAGRRTKATPGTAVTTADPMPAMGPLEEAVHRRDAAACAVYRKKMAAAAARRLGTTDIEELDARPTKSKSMGKKAGARDPLAALRRPPAEDDDFPDSPRGQKIEAVAAVDVAARLMFARQIDAHPGLAESIRNGSPVVTVDVADSDILDRIGRKWSDVVLPGSARCVKISGAGGLRHGECDAIYLVAKEPVKAKDADGHRRIVLEAMSLAVPVFVFSPRAASYLPSGLGLAFAEKVVIPPLDAATIVRTIEAVTGRTCRTALDDATVSATDPASLSLAVRFDRSPSDCVARLRRLAADKSVKRDSRDLSLDELHGMDSAVSWARSAIADLNSWRRGDVGIWSAVSSKVLLNGPPGTGKTTFALVFARAAGLPIVTASLAGWQSQGHLGDLLKAMRQDFQKARDLANTSQGGGSGSGCVLFIDEVDTFPDRNKIRHDHADYVIEVVSGLLELIDGLAGNEKIFFVAACNDVRRCDPALVRPGRFNPVIEIGLPGLADLEKMFRVRLGPDLVDADLREVCERALGGSGAEVERIVNDGRRLARHDGARPLAMQDLLTIVKGEDNRPEALRRRTAIHESGHIIIDVLFNGAAGIHATISPSRGVGGRVVRTESKETAGTYDDYSRRIQVLLAGRTAEILMCGNCGHGSGGVAGSDMEIAGSMAAAMAGSVGLAGTRPLLFLAARENTPELLSYPEVRLAANEELTKAADSCRALLQRHRGALEAVTEVLLAEGRIDGHAVAMLMAESNRPGGIPRKPLADRRTSSAPGASPKSGTTPVSGEGRLPPHGENVP
ncbi:AAA family ATPase [Tardiphaga sp.]|uniref:AAA family ATPase n=1 Tax=Tardiphaga sp. TaxID=1926292 RepID=UPI00352A32A9